MGFAAPGRDGEAYPPAPVPLPWRVPDAAETTAKLLFTRNGAAINKNTFNGVTWRPALKRAGIDAKAPDTGMHGLRHTYASALLEDGVSIKAVAAYLGHTDEAFTLRTYTHLMPTTDERARKAIDRAFGASGSGGVPNVYPQSG